MKSLEQGCDIQWEQITEVFPPTLPGTVAMTRRKYDSMNFFKLCKKYNVRWTSADEKENQFLSEVARLTYERDRAKHLDLPLSEIRPSFTQ